MRSALAALTFILTTTTVLAASPDAILSANRAASGGNILARKAALHTEYDYAGNGLTGKVSGTADLADDGEKSDGGATYDVLTVVPKGGATFDAWFDAKTHLLARIYEAQGGVMNVTTLSNYRAFDGVPQAVDTKISTGDPKYDQHLTLTKAALLAASDASDYAPPKSAAADFAIAGGAHAVTLPFDLRNNHIYANVAIDGKGPYYCVFDTGGLNLVTPATAKALGLKVEGHLEGRGAGEATMDFGFTHVDRIDVGGATIDNQLFTVFDLDALYPAGGIRMQGMVGYETFRRFVTRIDYGGKTVTLIDPKFFDPRDAGTPVHIAFNGNAVVVEGSYDGIPGKFQIDTGSRSALTLDGPFVAANHIGEHAAKVVEAVDGWGVGGASHSRVMRGGPLKIGSIEAAEHPVVGMGIDKKGALADPTISGNIGGGILKRFVVTFDYANNVMYLKPVTGTVSDLDSYDRAGSWFNIDSDGFKVIDVTRGGPAEAAGLKVGDVIVAVDGKPVSGSALAALRERLRNAAPGSVVTFHLASGKDMKITLKDQI